MTTKVLTILKGSVFRGAFVAQSIKCVAPDFDSGS